MLNLEYREKYLKYKGKYINLKNKIDQDGGKIKGEGDSSGGMKPWVGSYIIFFDSNDFANLSELGQQSFNTAFPKDAKYNNITNINDIDKNNTEVLFEYNDTVNNNTYNIYRGAIGINEKIYEIKKSLGEELWYWSKSTFFGTNPIKRNINLLVDNTEAVFNKACSFKNYDDFHVITPVIKSLNLIDNDKGVVNFNNSIEVINFIIKYLPRVKNIDNMRNEAVCESIKKYKLKCAPLTSKVQEFWYGCYIYMDPRGTGNRLMIAIKMNEKSKVATLLEAREAPTSYEAPNVATSLEAPNAATKNVVPEESITNTNNERTVTRN